MTKDDVSGGSDRLKDDREVEFMTHYNYTKIMHYVKKGFCRECNNPIIVKVTAYLDINRIIRQIFLEEISKDGLRKNHTNLDVNSPIIYSEEFYNRNGAFNEYIVVTEIFKSYFAHDLKIYDFGILEPIDEDGHCSIYEFIFNHEYGCGYQIMANREYKGIRHCPYLIMEYLDFGQYPYFYNEESDTLIVLSETAKSIKLAVDEFTRKEIDWLQTEFIKKSIKSISE